MVRFSQESEKKLAKLKRELRKGRPCYYCHRDADVIVYKRDVRVMIDLSAFLFVCNEHVGRHEVVYTPRKKKKA